MAARLHQQIVLQDHIHKITQMLSIASFAYYFSWDDILVDAKYGKTIATLLHKICHLIPLKKVWHL